MRIKSPEPEERSTLTRIHLLCLIIASNRNEQRTALGESWYRAALKEKIPKQNAHPQPPESKKTRKQYTTIVIDIATHARTHTNCLSAHEHTRAQFFNSWTPQAKQQIHTQPKKCSMICSLRFVLCLARFVSTFLRTIDQLELWLRQHGKSCYSRQRA